MTELNPKYECEECQDTLKVFIGKFDDQEEVDCDCVVNRIAEREESQLDNHLQEHGSDQPIG